MAIDYSLLVTRWRQELAAEATRRCTAMATAGRSVAYSGVTVAIGLLSLIVLPCPHCAASGSAACSCPR